MSIQQVDGSVVHERTELELFALIIPFCLQFLLSIYQEYYKQRYTMGQKFIDTVSQRFISFDFLDRKCNSIKRKREMLICEYALWTVLNSLENFQFFYYLLIPSSSEMSEKLREIANFMLM